MKNAVFVISSIFLILSALWRTREGMMQIQSGDINIRGTALKPCSKKGMALTGYKRDGHCSYNGGDTGSHHVCLDINAMRGKNFCEMTGQPNWCAEESQCHDSSGKCSKKNWCVCQWAYDKALSSVSCDEIEIDCDATNMKALEAYQKEPIKYEKALRCLLRKCPQKST